MFEMWTVVAGMAGAFAVLAAGGWLLKVLARAWANRKEERLRREEEGRMLIRSHRGQPRWVRILGPAPNGRVHIVWQGVDGRECCGRRSPEVLERLRLA